MRAGFPIGRAQWWSQRAALVRKTSAVLGGAKSTVADLQQDSRLRPRTLHREGGSYAYLYPRMICKPRPLYLPTAEDWRDAGGKSFSIESGT